MKASFLRRCCTSEVFLVQGLMTIVEDVTFGSCGAGVAQGEFAGKKSKQGCRAQRLRRRDVHSANG